MGVSRNGFRRRRKIRSQGDADRLSELPESLIAQILSLLEMKDAVKTSVLSKRWKHHWTLVNNIVYNCPYNILRGGQENMSREQIQESSKKQMKLYVSFIKTTLMQCVPNIKMFSLSGSFFGTVFNNKRMHAMVDKWIEYVLEKKVEVLKLRLDRLVHPAPECLYRSSSLTELNLKGVSIDILSPVNWSSLKSLYLKCMTVEDSYMKNVFLGCPVLESLVLDDIVGLNHLNIMSQSVKKIKLVDFHYVDADVVDDTLDIRAPWLEELEILDIFLVDKCRILDVSSLVKATFRFTTHPPIFKEDSEDDEDIAELVGNITEYNYGWIHMVTELLKALSHVDELLIGSQLIQVLSLSKLSGKSSPSFKCKHVTVVSPLWKYDVPGIACLLENSPHLETLVINVSSQYQLPLSQCEEVSSNKDPNSSLTKANFEHLKNVKIEYHQGPCYDPMNSIDCIDDDRGLCFDFELLGYIMRNAGILEKLVLSSKRSSFCYSCKMLNCAFQHVLSLAPKLETTFVSGTEAAEWKTMKGNVEYSFLKAKLESSLT